MFGFVKDDIFLLKSSSAAMRGKIDNGICDFSPRFETDEDIISIRKERATENFLFRGNSES